MVPLLSSLRSVMAKFKLQLVLQRLLVLLSLKPAMVRSRLLLVSSARLVMDSRRYLLLPAVPHLQHLHLYQALLLRARLRPLKVLLLSPLVLLRLLEVLSHYPLAPLPLPLQVQLLQGPLLLPPVLPLSALHPLALNLLLADRVPQLEELRPLLLEQASLPPHRPQLPALQPILALHQV